MFTMRHDGYEQRWVAACASCGKDWRTHTAEEERAGTTKGVKVSRHDLVRLFERHLADGTCRPLLETKTPQADPTDHSIAERIARWDLADEARYLVLARNCRYRWDRDTNLGTYEPSMHDDYSLVGGLHPTLFKTLRNAREKTGTGVGQPVRKGDHNNKPPGVIFLLDLRRLPVIDGNDIHVQADADEFAFAERQMDMWSLRAAALARKQ